MCHEIPDHQCEYAACKNGKADNGKPTCCFSCSNIPTCQLACDDAKEWRKFRCTT